MAQARGAEFGMACLDGTLWLGNASPGTPMDGVSGGGLPASIWRAIMVDAARA